MCYTYAAISIERILFIRQGNQLMCVFCSPPSALLPFHGGVLITNNVRCRFASADIKDIAPQMLDALLAKVEKAPTPEKVAENDYLMKCASPSPLRGSCEFWCSAWNGRADGRDAV